MIRVGISMRFNVTGVTRAPTPWTQLTFMLNQLDASRTLLITTPTLTPACTLVKKEVLV